MTKDIHEASNNHIAKYLEKEVSVTMSRSDAHGLALILRDRIKIAEDTLSDDEREYLKRLHRALVSV